MKKLFVFLTMVVLILISGCSYTGLYILSLREVHRPQDTKNRYGDHRIINFTEDNVANYVYEDELIKIIWYSLSNNFKFTLENKSEHSIKIIWDEAVFINAEGSSARLIHSSVKMVDKDKTQLPTVIPTKSIFNEHIFPVDNVDYVRDITFGGYKWVVRHFIPNKAASRRELDELTKKYIGKTLKVLIPIQIQDVINEYIFCFKIEDFILYSRETESLFYI